MTHPQSKILPQDHEWLNFDGRPKTGKDWIEYTSMWSSSTAIKTMRAAQQDALGMLNQRYNENTRREALAMMLATEWAIGHLVGQRNGDRTADQSEELLVLGG